MSLMTNVVCKGVCAIGKDKVEKYYVCAGVFLSGLMNSLSAEA